MLILSVLLVAVGLFAVGGGLYLTRAEAAEVAATQQVALTPEEADEVPAAGFGYRAVEPLLEAGGRVLGRLAPAARVELIRNRIVYAGLEASWTPERQFGVDAVAAVLGFVFGLLLLHIGSVPSVVWGLVLGAIVFFVPDVLLDSRARERQNKIGKSLPDALDLLAICVEAGLGLEQGLSVVTEKLEGPLGEEFARLLGEVELGVSRRDALGLLRERTDVRELSAFVVALLQAEELGVSVGEVLKVQASQVRLVRTQKARERAAKTPVKILFPLIFGVFPAIFVVSVGPGAISIYHSIVK